MAALAVPTGALRGPGQALSHLLGLDRPPPPVVAPATPLAFEANRGQTDPEVAFLAQTRESTLFLTPGEVVWRARAGGVLRQSLVGGSPAPAIEGLDLKGGTVNHYAGTDPSRWLTGVPLYGKVAYRSVYPGIDALFYGRGEHLEYDFLVAPGAAPDDIALAFEGATSIDVDGKGDLVLGLRGGGEIRQRAPVAHQPGPGGPQAVEARFVLRADGTVGFSLGRYDPALPLVIDPVVIVYSTYLGGSRFDYGLGIGVDEAGDIVVAGNTQSRDFPMKNAVDGDDTVGLVPDDAFVAKIRPAGQGQADLIYSTYLSGTDNDEGRQVVIDAKGDTYVIGNGTFDFPTTPGAFQTACVGDVFVAKLSPAGALIWSTCIGGDWREEGVGLAVDRSGHAHFIGMTKGADFPVVNALQPTRASDIDEAIVGKLNPSGTGLLWATFLGGSGIERGQGITVDRAGAVYVAGFTSSSDFPMAGTPFDTTLGGPNDAFVAKINPSGSALVWSTYLGGSWTDTHGTHKYMGMAVDDKGQLTLASATDSEDFPTTPGAFSTVYGGEGDVFVTRFNSSGSGLIYSALLGGSGDEDFGSTKGLWVDPAGFAYVSGGTGSPDFPLVNSERTTMVGFTDAFIAKINPSGSALIYSILLGGFSGDAHGGAVPIAIDADGYAYVTGLTISCDFPTTPGAYRTALTGACPDAGTGGDAFITKLDPFLGFLRVVTNPALPSQITVDGVPRATWGTINLEVTPGSHEVCFRAVEGFTTPACQTVTVNNSAVTTVTGNYGARGFLQVVTNPALPGTISVNGVARDDWGIYTDYPVGSYTVCFGPVAGFTPPACRNVSVTAGQTTTVTGNYTASAGAPGPAAGKGFLRATTNPALPSQISVDGIPRATWGLINLPLDPGDHSVCFRDIEGRVTPACQTVAIVAGQTKAVEGAFAPKGFLQAVTSPALPAAIYVDGVARDDWGIFTDLPTGTHEVCFGEVKGYYAPACQSVNLTGPTVTVTGTYLPK